MPDDKTKAILRELLSNLYTEEAQRGHEDKGSSLIADDGQFLGKITSNAYESDSILNGYGPYGSEYSQTSIFNRYSQYGSPYGLLSLHNPYSTKPPKLFIKGKLLGSVSANTFVPNRISPEAFLFTLRNRLQNLLAGQILESEETARRLQRESFIEAHDGKFLGSLTPNTYDADSIFNSFGPYGSKYSPDSIFNPYGTYGGQFSALSPFNQMAITPPKIFLRGQLAGYLTKNPTMQNSIDPDHILNWAKENAR